jgi:hypothetical protein
MLKDFIWGPVSCKSPWHSSCRAFSGEAACAAILRTPQVLIKANISEINDKQPLACPLIKTR